MARGPSITSLLVDHLGLAETDLAAARNRIGDFLKAHVDIHYALDDEIAGVAQQYMASNGAWTHFSNQAQLRWRWSSDLQHAEIENTVGVVMLTQQVYALEQLHRGEGPCPGCRYHPSPSQPDSHRPQHSAQQQSTPSQTEVPSGTIASSARRASRAQAASAQEEGASHIEDPSPSHINATAMDNDDDSDDVPISSKRRKR